MVAVEPIELDAAKGQLPVAGSAHVWIVRLPVVLRDWSTWHEVLSRDEVERMMRFVRTEDRQRFGITRSVLRRLLGGYLGRSPEGICFGTSRFGRPLLLGDAGKPTPGLSFSVSHSGDYALLGFAARRPIGVDVERMRADATLFEIAPTMCGADEWEDVSRLPEAERREELYRRWTIKEAYTKALGLGLSYPLANAVVIPARGGTEETHRERYELRVPGRWTVLRPKMPRDYSAAVILAREGGAIRMFRVE